ERGDVRPFTRGVSGIVPDDALEPGRAGRGRLLARRPPGAGAPLSRVLVPDLRLHPAARGRRRGRARPDADLLHATARERPPPRRRPAERSIPVLPEDRLHLLPGRPARP